MPAEVTYLVVAMTNLVLSLSLRLQQQLSDTSGLTCSHSCSFSDSVVLHVRGLCSVRYMLVRCCNAWVMFQNLPSHSPVLS